MLNISPKHEIKKCLRCQTEFECKVGTITECHCFQIQLTEEERTFIRYKGFEDCLCGDCMRRLKEEFEQEMNQR